MIGDRSLSHALEAPSGGDMEPDIDRQQPGTRNRRGKSLVPYKLILPLAVGLLTVLVVGPIVVLVVLSLQETLRLGSGGLSLTNYAELFGDAESWEALGNTIAFTVGGAALGMVLGTVMAWAVTSVNLPFRNVLRALPLCVLILPGLVKDPAWIIFFSPDTGLVNIVASDLFGIDGVFDIFSMEGMIVVTGVFAAPTAYVIMLAPLQAIDRSFVEASRVSGARLHTTLRRVVVPMVRPALFSATMLVVIGAASSFETPILIGLPADIPTYMGVVFQNASIGTDLNFVATQGTMYLLLTGTLVALYLLSTRNERRFAAIAGRGSQPNVIQAPVLRWVLAGYVVFYSLIAFVGPLLLILAVSFLPYYSTVEGNPFTNWTLQNYDEVFTTPHMLDAVQTSTILATTVSVGTIVVAGFLAVMAVKGKGRMRKWSEVIAMSPIAVPHFVYGLGFLLTVLSIPVFAQLFYGTRQLMFFAEVVIFLPLAMRLLSSALIQVPDELVEASLMSSAGMARTVRSILLPILRPAVLYIAAVVFVFSYRELGAIVLLAADDTTVLPYLSLAAWTSGGYPELAALNMIIMVIPLAVVALAVVFGNARSPEARTSQSAVVQPTAAG